MSDELDPVLVAKWIAGRLDADDQRLLDQWLAADPGRAAELEELRDLWRRAGEMAETHAANADPAESARWAGVLRAIREPVRAVEFPFAQRRSRAWGWVAAAAALALLAGGGLWVADRSRREVAQVPRPMRVHQTSRGERAEFRLSDGTRVMLNVESRVRVPADFGEQSRTVYLEGGAYFDVAHDARRPFAVHAGDLVAKDLGTEFTVRAYPEDQHARVVVRAGKVALRSAIATDTASVATLEPGELGSLDAAGMPVVQKADTAADFAWTGGTLVLDGTPLRDALPQLGRWFDLEFRLADRSLGRIPVAATLINQPTDEALAFLAASLGLREVRRGRIVTFYSANARN
jgi:transmembrane sensor